MLKPFPAEDRRDVIAVARRSEASVAQVAQEFGISETCLQRLRQIADREDGPAPATSGERAGGGKNFDAELGELPRRNELLGRGTRFCGGPLVTAGMSQPPTMA